MNAQVGDALGLDAHPVVDHSGERKVLHLAFDANVHVGSDGRLYATGLGRLTPPAPALEDAAHATCRLRPELLVRHRLRLSPDTLSDAVGEGRRRLPPLPLAHCGSHASCRWGHRGVLQPRT